ncbi:MAG: DUF6472 family protein [Lachnospiraceae bacterium]|nr:DUF6472 family protein [Lachnospiraceae bacterium]
MQCESCALYFYDEDYEEWVCDAQMDEDDFAKISYNKYESCPFYRDGDEYKVVRKQL